MDRSQFTFYSSFFESASRIRSKSARADLYDAICRYALSGQEPDLGKLPEPSAVAFINARPNLEAGRRKARAGAKGGSKPKASESRPEANGSKAEANGSKAEANGSKAEANGSNQEARECGNLGKTATEKEKEKEKEKEYECTPLTPHGAEESRDAVEREFEQLWNAYPQSHRGRKEEARAAFDKSRVLANRDGIIQERLEIWKQSQQWNKAGGQYIPSLKNWLLRATWQESPAKMAAPMGASGNLGAAEMEAIRQVMAQNFDDLPPISESGE